MRVAGSHDSYGEMDERLPELIRFLDEAVGRSKGGQAPSAHSGGRKT
jgi:hypothetical protein